MSAPPGAATRPRCSTESPWTSYRSPRVAAPPGGGSK
ncbi:hypothetical protein PQB35_gp06 [Ochrobactrum phage vB_OspP_OH]|uniref:Uncharacterized protein n=1 Tax=Ochrobactrum phage vB_OspP_OH TaxID=2712957 RepID=A0A6G6XXL7_9CAUD|nr:hypothetical protein PQB35_gp06 [Ochrobactrum phage vB_OspP_OH]QIG66062.1 hypothetical protein phiOH_p06 [Ochrobactrum phage vB_OspP_OH]